MKLFNMAGAVIALALTFGAASVANANTYTLNLTAGQNGPAPYGSVDVILSAPNTLQYTVTLNNGMGFVDTGSHNAFSFALVGAPALTYVGPAGFTLSTASNGISNSPFGGFDYGLNCSVCVQANNGYHQPLIFTVSAAGLSLASIDFADDYNGNKIRFAADTINQGVTAAVGGSILTSVPETATWGMMMLGLGMVGLGLRIRRRTVTLAA